MKQQNFTEHHGSMSRSPIHCRTRLEGRLTARQDGESQIIKESRGEPRNYLTVEVAEVVVAEQQHQHHHVTAPAQQHHDTTRH